MINDPTSQIIATALSEQCVSDNQGRRLSLRRLTALDRLRLFKAIGANLAQNEPYLGVAMLATSVTAIDGVPVPPPITEAQLESLVQKLGDDGIVAVASALSSGDSGAAELVAAGN